MAEQDVVNATPTPPRGATTTENRASKKEIGTVAIESIKQIVDMLKPYELSQSQRLKTYQAMMLDDAVGNAFGSNAILIEKAFSKYYLEYDKNDPESTVAAEFLSYVLESMTGNQTVRSIARNAAEFKRDGLAPFEKLFKKDKDEWSGFWIIDTLNYINPLTLALPVSFTVTDGGRKVTEMRQSLTAFRNSPDKGTFTNMNTLGYQPIPRNKLTFMTYSATDGQPFGQSPFDQCYTAWREKVLLQDYTLVGVTKDFSGTPVISVPLDLLSDAGEDPSSQAGIMLEQIKTNAANMHTGDQNYVILPSDTLSENGSGNRAFDIQFKGVEGGGKAFDTEALIEQRKKAIYNCFGAANLISGENGGGSYNLIEGQNSIHAHYVERDISIIEEAWNKDIIPQLFRLNEWNLPKSKLPKLRAGEIEPVSLDEIGKFLNRTNRMLPAVPEVQNKILELAGIPYRAEEEATYEDIRESLFDFEEPSKVGAGNSGTTQEGGQNSDTNDENSS